MTPVYVRPTHLLSMKRCTAFNAMIRRMAILINTFLRQMAFAILVVFLSLSSLLHEEMLASSARRRGKNAASSPGMHGGCYGILFPIVGASVVQFDETFLQCHMHIGERDIPSPCRMKRVFKFIFVPSPFTICVAIVNRWALV